jgi:Metallo-peptidase family M12B Reprolysin-like/Secretion system C-terminal sorting domain
MRKQLLAFCLAGAATVLSAQTGKYWQASTATAKSIKANKFVARAEFPKEFKLFKLDINPLREELFASFSKSKARVAGKKIIISLPNTKGEIEDFEVFEASNFDPELQAKFPEIRAYSGISLSDNTASLKLSISPEGIQTMVFRDEKESEFIEAYSEDKQTYAVFNSQRNGRKGFKCSVKDTQVLNSLTPQVEKKQKQYKSSAATLKTLRLAQSCTGEYANAFDARPNAAANQVTLLAANQARVLAAFNATYTRCNGIFEKDLGLHLNLIARTTEVIFYNAATDPYSNAGDSSAEPNDNLGAGGRWNGELMNTLHNTLGDNAFDIGHLFGASGGGGQAGCIGCMCSNDMDTYQSDTTPAYAVPYNYKGAGFTSPGSGVPSGEAFDVDYVAHEIGHQLGGNHTHTHNPEAENAVQVEVGSGISIMGYANITDAADVANRSIDAFHGVSIDQIQRNLATSATSCISTVANTNATPTVTVSANITIPISTPFALDCRGADTNATNVLTYSWEQADQAAAAQKGANADGTVQYSNATETKPTGPNFISEVPTRLTYKYFPKMTTVMQNRTTTVATNGDAGMNSEALPSIARTLNFKVTVRDNAPYRSTAPITVGQTIQGDMVVNVDATGGAFRVTSQSAANTAYNGGSNQTITWTRGSTHVAPFNARNVDILITYDNGATWQVLLANTPNDGTQLVAMPNPAATQTNCRIMVRSAVTQPVATPQSYFFNVNTKAFTINRVVALATDVIEEKLTGLALYPNPNNGDFNIRFTPNTKQTDIRVYDLNGALVFTQSYANAGAQFDEKINLVGLEAGTYFVSIADGDQQSIKKIIIK